MHVILFGHLDFHDIIRKRGEIAIEKYVKLAKKYNIAPSTFANAFVNDRPFVTSNIIGATTMDQLKRKY